MYTYKCNSTIGIWKIKLPGEKHKTTYCICSLSMRPLPQQSKEVTWGCSRTSGKIPQAHQEQRVTIETQ